MAPRWKNVWGSQFSPGVQAPNNNTWKTWVVAEYSSSCSIGLGKVYDY